MHPSASLNPSPASCKSALPGLARNINTVSLSTTAYPHAFVPLKNRRLPTPLFRRILCENQPRAGPVRPTGDSQGQEQLWCLFAPRRGRHRPPAPPLDSLLPGRRGRRRTRMDQPWTPTPGDIQVRTQHQLRADDAPAQTSQSNEQRGPHAVAFEQRNPQSQQSCDTQPEQAAGPQHTENQLQAEGEVVEEAEPRDFGAHRT